jgi:flagellar motility protein MotE (MotC chaperone)
MARKDALEDEKLGEEMKNRIDELEDSSSSINKRVSERLSKIYQERKSLHKEKGGQ